MMLTLGATVLAATVLTLVLAALLIRKPGAPAWAQAGWLQSALAIALVASASVGIAMMLDGAFALAGLPLAAALGHLSVPALILAGAIAAIRAIHPLRRLAGYAGTAVSTPPSTPLTSPHQPA